MLKDCSPDDLLKWAAQLATAAERFKALGNTLKAEGLPPIKLEIASRKRCIKNVFQFSSTLDGKLDNHRHDVEAERLGRADREAEEENL